jgi:hypothetical protein
MHSPIFAKPHDIKWLTNRGVMLVLGYKSNLSET